MSDFFICGHKMYHPVHGTFFLSRLYATEGWYVSRVYRRQDEPEPVVEVLADAYALSLAQAKRAVRKRIAELEAALVVHNAEAAQ